MGIFKLFKHLRCAIFFIILQGLCFAVAISYELYMQTMLELYWSVALLILPTLTVVMFNIRRQSQEWDDFDLFILKVSFSFVHLAALLTFVKYIHPTFLPNYETMLIPFDHFYIFGSAFLQYLTIELALFAAHEMGYVGKKDALLPENKFNFRS